MLKVGSFRIAGAHGRALFDRVHAPSRYLSRLRGLIGRPPLSSREAWWFQDCSAVHTFGMRYPIDVIHLSTDGTIVQIVAGLAPNRWSWCRSSRHLIEAGNGAARELDLHLNDRLEYVE